MCEDALVLGTGWLPDGRPRFPSGALNASNEGLGLETQFSAVGLSGAMSTT